MNTRISEAACFRVLLIEDGNVQVAYECASRSEANAWVEEWDREHLGIVAIVWPSWAPQDLVAVLCDRKAGAR